MYRICHDSMYMVNYLKNDIFKYLPKELWDRYLFLYNKLLKLMDFPFTDPNRRANNIEFYILENDFGFIENLICKEVFQDKVNYYICANNYDEVKNFLIKETEHMFQSLDVYVIDEKLKSYILDNLGGDIISYHIKLYTRSPITNMELINCSIINKVDLKSNRELNHLKYPSQFLHYFGHKDGERFTSICGISPLNAWRSEVISVNTLFSEYKNKGYAKKVCAFAINYTMEFSSIFTWTADEDNIASINLAKSLGFTEFQRKCCVRIK